MKTLRDNRGVVAVEFAIIAPVLIVMLMGMVNYGLAMIAYQRLQFGVESAAKCGGTGQCKTGPDMTGYADNSAQISGASYIADFEPCGARVAGTYEWNLVGLFPPMTLNAAACYPQDKT